MHDPRTGKPTRAYRPAREEWVDAVIERARREGPAWGGYTPAVREAVIRQWTARLRRNSTLIEAEASQRGIPYAQARVEVAAALDIIDFYASAARTATAPAAGAYLPGHHSRVSYRPLGVVGAILPWNYPLMMFAWRVGPMLAAGNAVIVKPAEETPGSACIAETAAREHSLPVYVLPGDRETGRLLAASGLDGYGFTGSINAGSAVAAVAAPAPVSLELGGNCPAIFLDDAPLGSEDRLVAGAIYNAGQSCAGMSRIITTSTEAAERVMAAVRRSTPDAPLISAQARARTLAALGAASERGAVIGHATGNLTEQQVDWQADGGYWMEPTALQVAPFSEALIRIRETFAPVITVEVCADQAEALASALDPACGNDLAASVWTNDLAAAETLSAALGGQVGEVWINTALQQTAELPHSSRSGLDLSPAALDQYRRPTTITTAI